MGKANDEFTSWGTYPNKNQKQGVIKPTRPTGCMGTEKAKKVNLEESKDGENDQVEGI